MIGEIRSDTTNIIERFKYIEHVPANDTLCTSGIRKAERQAKDTLCFVIWTVWRPLRYENELKEVVKRYGLKLDYEFGDDFVFQNQTQGCYKDYMDKKLTERFGKNFKITQHVKADSLFLINHLNDTICSWDCDKEPKFASKRIGPDGIDVEVKLPVKEQRNEWTSNGRKLFAVYRPFMDIQFTVDKQGNVATFEQLYFNSQRDENIVFKDQLWMLAKKEIETKYSKWTPATIRGVNVNSSHVIRVQFKTTR
ncbi:MAG: hypothetical protein JSS79_20755 [Bacteroidetes bacterium]|nr:hypothetical protein [Bacteroidota bacterium]